MRNLTQLKIILLFLRFLNNWLSLIIQFFDFILKFNFQLFIGLFIEKIPPVLLNQILLNFHWLFFLGLKNHIFNELNNNINSIIRAKELFENAKNLVQN